MMDCTVAQAYCARLGKIASDKSAAKALSICTASSDHTVAGTRAQVNRRSRTSVKRNAAKRTSVNVTETTGTIRVTKTAGSARLKSRKSVAPAKAIRTAALRINQPTSSPSYYSTNAPRYLTTFGGVHHSRRL